MSVGASARQIKVMVIKDGYRPVVEGLMLGLWGGPPAGSWRAYMDVEVAVVDPVMLGDAGAVAARRVLRAIGRRRAAKVDPTVALRCE